MLNVDQLKRQALHERQRAEYHLQRAILFEEMAQKLMALGVDAPPYPIPAQPDISGPGHASPGNISIGSSRGVNNPFSQFLATRGHTIKSYADHLKQHGIWTGSTTAVQRWHNTTGQGRRCKKSIADWIFKDIGYPVDAAHWPNGLTPG